MTFTIAEDIKTLLTDNFDFSSFAKAAYLDDSIQLYWNFEDNLTDWASNGMGATAGSGVDYGDGSVWGADPNIGTKQLECDGTLNGKVTITSAKAFTNDVDNISISIWLHWTGGITGSGTLIYLNGANTGHFDATGISIVATGNTINVYVGNQIKAVAYASGYRNKWTHIFLTVAFSANSLLNVYFDNTQVVTNFDAGNHSFPTATNHQMGGLTNYFINKALMTINELRVYNKILSTTERTNLYEGFNINGSGTGEWNSSTTPNIRLLDDYSPDSHPDDGEIIIKDEQLLRIDPFNGSRSETFLVDIDVKYDDYTASAPTIIKLLLAEIDRVMDAESIAHTTYYYKPRYNWLGSYRLGVVRFQVEVLNALVVRPGLT
ncbi:hypothetical protein LCGC14_0547650 [marine sediment metagenome]|uniref:Uncharacterized protein n=1 Tax=marine sediment metagenome TaxID=412755 RepID=A0A0F9UZ29_9ZZZZ